MILQKSPVGLLEGLDLKTLGQNPDSFGNELAPVFHANQFYLQNLLAQAGAASTITAGSIAGPSITVPEGSTWRIRHVNCMVTSAIAGSAIGAFMTMVIRQIPGSPFTHVLANIDNPNTAAFAGVIYRATMFWQPTQDFFVPGGTVFSMSLVGGSASDMTVALRVLYEELGVTRPG